MEPSLFSHGKMKNNLDNGTIDGKKYSQRKMTLFFQTTDISQKTKQYGGKLCTLLHRFFFFKKKYQDIKLNLHGKCFQDKIQPWKNQKIITRNIKENNFDNARGRRREIRRQIPVVAMLVNNELWNHPRC